MRPTSGIYKLQSKINDKVYIGETLNLPRRRVRHFSELRHGIHKNIYLQRHVDKHGISDLVFVVLEELPKNKELLQKAEKGWVRVFNSNDYKNGFNLNKGGLGGSDTNTKHKNFNLIRILDGKVFHFNKVSDFEERMDMSECRHKVREILNGTRKVSLGWTTVENYKEIVSNKEEKIAEIERKKNSPKPKPPLYVKPFTVKNIRTNQVVEGINIREFCIHNNLTYNSMLRVIRGERGRHKIWIKG